MSLTIRNTTLSVIQGDLTELEVDAIVSAANDKLWMGSGVASAIKTKGGRIIEEEAIAQGPAPVGEAIVTTAGNLPSIYVIHAVGAEQGAKPSRDSLAKCTKNSLLRAEERNLKSIAFPAIGTGVAGFPVEECARIMLGVICDHLKGDTSLEKVIIALFDKGSYMSFSKVLDEIKANL
ncbi:MAG TPA: macro domain-containing protein [Candidatus Limnocylindrales bacterium]|jgi:O-acetyl-ADP-ribose deacetylase (regulator of RNase III)|nr:macro domain-containing protein [Candidatus Limnocylindrales bacterium]